MAVGAAALLIGKGLAVNARDKEGVKGKEYETLFIF